MDSTRKARALRAAGARGPQVDELLRYDENIFDLGAAATPVQVPLPDEAFVAVWAAWAREAESEGAIPVLRRYLPQLAFPVREEISQSGAYRAATLRGVPVRELPEATGLELEHPELVALRIYTSFAGRIPVLEIRGREELVKLIQALAKRNEPVPVPASQGALMVAGFNNWRRIRALRESWERQAPKARETTTWAEEFARLRARKELYQDRFILLSDGPYSAVPATDLGLEDDTWREMSLVLRREHECAHYFTRRHFGAMRNHLLDELIADYTGLVAAAGRFRSTWFLRFLGLEDFPNYREGARLDLYRGQPPLSNAAFRVLCAVIKSAAETVEGFDRAQWPGEASRTLEDRALMVRAKACLSLVELASEDGQERLAEAVERCLG